VECHTSRGLSCLVGRTPASLFQGEVKNVLFLATMMKLLHR
jgi:hypothetical protein